jgi:outer membrane lipoprotein-sorting protein
VTPNPESIATADDLLAKLETADKDLTSLQADMQYDRVFELAGDRQIRTGKLYYVDSKAKTADGKAAPGSRKFAIRFSSLRLGEEPARIEEKVMVFDGEWLIEKNPAVKQIIKRHVVAPGQSFDPLKIGEGPFPLPIGQKREDILQRFTAELLNPEEGLVANDPKDLPSLKKFVADTYQLKLVPKDPKSEFKEVRLWYQKSPDKKTLIPRMARTVNQADDVSLVELTGVTLNQTVPTDVMDAKSPTGWEERVEEMAERTAPIENRR